MVQCDEEAGVVNCYYLKDQRRQDVHTPTNMDDDREGIPVVVVADFLPEQDVAAEHMDEDTHPY